ncbi:EpsG family protein [Aeromonas caviae]|uniref:EpsG family protein n=1 Tax=Aeromonas caviae TaxID=648 RepID=UPI003014BAAE
MILLEAVFGIFFIFSCLEFVFFKYMSREMKLSLLLCPMAFVFVVAGFNTTSPDYLNYLQYISLSKLDGLSYVDEKLIEPFFSFTSALIYFITGDLKISYALFPVTSCFLISYVVFKKSPFFFLSMLIYLSHAYLNKELIQIRAGLISALLVFSVYLISEKKNIKSSILLIISPLIHFSASAQFIPLSFLHFMRNKVGLKSGVVVLVILSMIFSMSGAFDFIITFLSSVNLIPDVVNGYLGWDEYNYKLGLLNPVLLKGIFVFLLSLIILKTEIEHDVFVRYSWCLYAFGIFWLALFSDIAILAARISSIFSIFEIFLLSICLERIRYWRALLFMLISVYAVITLFINLYIKDILSNIDLGLA